MMFEAQAGNPRTPEPREAAQRKPRHWETHAERLKLTPVPLTLSDEAMEEINNMREEFPREMQCGYDCKSTIGLETGSFGWVYANNVFTFDNLPQYYCANDDVTEHPPLVRAAMSAAIIDFFTRQISDAYPATSHAAAFSEEYRPQQNPQE